MMSKENSFESLVRVVSGCTSCHRMGCSKKVLSKLNGNIHATIMFIGEAPGRLGAELSLIPFYGDKAGSNFEQLLFLNDLRRTEVFITNAALCNPRDEAGNNATPSSLEIENCSQFLKAQIDLIDPVVIVTLGSIALKALQHIESHNFKLSTHVRTIQKWYNKWLIPLYHPGQRALIHRSFMLQVEDYSFIRHKAHRLGAEVACPV